MTDRSEKAIQNDTLIAITALPELMCWRNNTGMAWQGIEHRAGVGQTVRVERGMVILKEARPIRFSIPGAPDIIGVSAGRGFGLEMKTRTGKQREDQAKFQAAWERAGGLYGMPRSVEEALAILRRS